MREQQVQASRSPSRCPWCRDDLAGVKALVACGPCGARHHAACYDEHGSCASCGATEPLRSATKPAHSSSRPPIGSQIEVTVDGDRTTYAWGSRTWTNWFLAFMCLIVPPIGLWYLYRVVRETRGTLILTPDALECTVQTYGGLGVVRRSFPRDEVGAIKVQGNSDGIFMTVDHGVTRHVVNTGPVVAALSAPEFEWLAERIRTWKG